MGLSVPITGSLMGPGAGGRLQLYVDTVSGNNTYNGLTPTTARQTLESALTLLAANYGNVGDINITAPSTAAVSPAGTTITIASGNIILRGLNGVTWYLERAASHTSNWTNEGGGIYSKNNSGNTGRVFVQTMTDGDGFLVELVRNTVTPTAPAAGEWGLSGTTMYVHLPGDANVWAHVLRQTQVPSPLTITGGTLKIYDAHMRYANAGVVALSGAANVTFTDCYFRYGDSGMTVSNTLTTCVRCFGQKNINDGFNHNANTLHLIDCEGSYNTDEGASPHNGSTLYVTGGRYHNNGAGGLTAANSAIMHLSRTRTDHNGTGGGAQGERGGINFGATSSGSVANTETDNNTGEGIYIGGTAGPVTITNLNSHDNTEPDVIP